MSRTLVSLCLALALLLTGACKSVLSTVPVGDQLEALDPAEWDGTWLYAPGSVTIKVTDAAGARLRLLLTTNDNDSLESMTYDCELLEHDGWTFLNLIDEEQPEHYFFMRVHNDDNQLLAWFPDADKIGALVREGVFPGIVDEHGNVRLDPLEHEQLEVLTSEERGVLFEWEQPVAMIRVTTSIGL